MFNSCCKLLAQEKIKIAFFESASAGYLAYRFSLSPYSGNILIGSLVSYDLRVALLHKAVLKGFFGNIISK